MNNLLRLPRWSLISLMIMTVLLCGVALTKIWFPELLPQNMIEKIFLSYLVVILSAWVVAKMSAYLQDMTDTPQDKSE